MTHNRALTNKQRSRQKKKIESQSPLGNLAKGTLKALVMSLSSAFLFMLIAAAIAVNTQDPGNSARPMGIAILIITALISGFFTQKFSGVSTIGSGAASAFVLSVFILIASLLIQNSIEGFTPGARSLMLLLILGGSVLGAILGNVRLVKKRRPKYKRH